MDEAIQTPIQNPTAQTPKTNWLLLLLAGIIILAIGIGVGLALGKYLPKQITSYEECIKANGNAIQPMYPGVCTVNGQRFVEELTEEEIKKINPPDPTANWKTYTNTKFGYSVNYPPTLTPLETTADIYLHQVALNGPEKTYLSGIIVEVRNLTNLEDEISYRTWRIVGHIAGKLDSEVPVTISGLSGKRLNYASGQKQFSIIIIPYQKLVYSIEAESNLLDQVLSTFKFLDQNVAQ